MPGNAPGGIVGAVVGGFLGALLGFRNISGFDLRSMALAVGGGLVALLLYGRATIGTDLITIGTRSCSERHLSLDFRPYHGPSILGSAGKTDVAQDGFRGDATS
jgi:hypothetical protein